MFTPSRFNVPCNRLSSVVAALCTAFFFLQTRCAHHKLIAHSEYHSAVSCPLCTACRPPKTLMAGKRRPAQPPGPRPPLPMHRRAFRSASPDTSPAVSRRPASLAPPGRRRTAARCPCRRSGRRPPSWRGAPGPWLAGAAAAAARGGQAGCRRRRGAGMAGAAGGGGGGGGGAGRGGGPGGPGRRWRQWQGARRWGCRRPGRPGPGKKGKRAAPPPIRRIGAAGSVGPGGILLY